MSLYFKLWPYLFSSFFVYYSTAAELIDQDLIKLAKVITIEEMDSEAQFGQGVDELPCGPNNEENLQNKSKDDYLIYGRGDIEILTEFSVIFPDDWSSNAIKKMSHEDDLLEKINTIINADVASYTERQEIIASVCEETIFYEKIKMVSILGEKLNKIYDYNEHQRRVKSFITPEGQWQALKSNTPYGVNRDFAITTSQFLKSCQLSKEKVKVEAFNYSHSHFNGVIIEDDSRKKYLLSWNEYLKSPKNKSDELGALNLPLESNYVVGSLEKKTSELNPEDKFKFAASIEEKTYEDLLKGSYNEGSTQVKYLISTGVGISKEATQSESSKAQGNNFNKEVIGFNITSNYSPKYTIVEAEGTKIILRPTIEMGVDQSIHVKQNGEKFEISTGTKSRGTSGVNIDFTGSENFSAWVGAVQSYDNLDDKNIVEFSTAQRVLEGGVRYNGDGYKVESSGSSIYTRDNSIKKAKINYTNRESNMSGNISYQIHDDSSRETKKIIVTKIGKTWSRITVEFMAQHDLNKGSESVYGINLQGKIQ